MWERLKRWIFADFHNSIRVLNEDVLIQTLKHLPLEQLTQLKNISEQFNYCVKEIFKRKKMLIISSKRETFRSKVWRYEHYMNLTNERIKNFNIFVDSKQLNTKETIAYYKSICKRCRRLKVLAINHQISDEFIKALAKITGRMEALYFGPLLLKLEITKLQTIGDTFEKRRIKILNLCFSKDDNYAILKLIALLERLQAVEELIVDTYYSCGSAICMVPNTIRIFDMQFRELWPPGTLDYMDPIKELIERMKYRFVLYGSNFTIDEEVFDLIIKKSVLNGLNVKITEIPMRKIFDFLVTQRKLTFLTIEWEEREWLIIEPELYRTHTLKIVDTLKIVNRKIQRKDFQSLLKCFPRVDSLTLTNIEFSCDCIEWTPICLECSYDCFEVMERCMSLKTIYLTDVNLRIRSLKRFSQLNEIVLFDHSIDHKYIVEKVQELCATKPREIFRLYLKTDIEKFNQLKENIPENIWMTKL